MRDDGAGRDREEFWREFWRSRLPMLAAFGILVPLTTTKLIESGGWLSLVGGGLLVGGLVLAWTPLPVRARDDAATGRVLLGFGLIVAAYAFDECRRGGVEGGGPWLALAGVFAALAFIRPPGERSER